MRQALVLALALAAGGAVAACAMGGRAKTVESTQPPMPDAAAPLSGRPDELRDQIRELDAKIQAEMGQARVETPDDAMAASMASTPMAEVRAVCEHTPSDRCEDVCKLSTSICDNASSICTLADQLPGDAWAAERCSSAKASCRRATERCCAGECAPSP
jgi:hypothetical protein